MALNLITPEEKDKVLAYLCEHFDMEDFSNNKSTNDFENDLQIGFVKLEAILKQFERLGLINKCTVFVDGDILIYLCMEAQDFLIRGGFVFKEGIFLANADKLLLEIDNLKKQFEPDQLGTIEKIANITNVLIAGATAYTTSK